MIDPLVDKFLDNLAIQNTKSARTVKYLLADFQKYVEGQHNQSASDLIRKLKEGKATDSPKEEQPYEILSGYSAYLARERIASGQNNAHIVRLKLYWARNLMESNFIPISKVLYKRLVRAPKAEEPALSPISKAEVRKVILALDDLRLQTFVLFIASMGWRSTQTLSIKLRHLEGLNLKTLAFDTDPTFINISGKDAKTKRAMRRQLTAELRSQIEVLLKHNYKTRIINRRVLEEGKLVWKKQVVEPIPNLEDRLFATSPTRKATLEMAYLQTSARFRTVTDRLGIGREESGKRRKITFHTMRRFAFTQCEKAVGRGYAEYHCGRKQHEYSNKTPEEIAEDFEAVEPVLTFMDTTKVEERQKVLSKELEATNKRIEDIKAFVKANLKSAEDIEGVQGTVANMTEEGKPRKKGKVNLP